MTTTSNENTNVSDAPLFDPFPEPQTMPSGWDLSEFTQDPGHDGSPQAEYEPEA
jgi:hypothetical protein